MKIELEKIEKLNGEIFYHIMIDGTSTKCFSGPEEEESAKREFEVIKEKMKIEKWPRITVLLQDEFPDPV